MSSDEQRTIDERWKYLRMIQKRYRRADQRGKGQLLDEMAAVTQLHRKSLVRLMGSELKRQPRGRERGATYGAGVKQALGAIAESLDWVCAERFQLEYFRVCPILFVHRLPLLISPLYDIFVSEKSGEGQLYCWPSFGYWLSRPCGRPAPRRAGPARSAAGPCRAARA